MSEANRFNWCAYEYTPEDGYKIASCTCGDSRIKITPTKHGVKITPQEGVKSAFFHIPLYE